VTATPRRRPLISGNWKMNFDHLEALHAARDLGLRLQPADTGAVDVSVHPPFTDLRTVQSVIEPEGIPVFLGAQNCAIEDAGAFTGEVSPLMLARLHVQYVIVGHSERRQMFGESDEVVLAKLRAVLRNDMTPICCVGETLEEREAGSTKDRLSGQVEAAIGTLAGESVGAMVIAYEPLWAIGSGQAATPVDPRHGRPVLDGRGCGAGPHPVWGVGHPRQRRIAARKRRHRRCAGGWGQPGPGRIRGNRPGCRPVRSLRLVTSSAVMRHRRRIGC
jgi:triosephosphate isomerase